MTSETPAAGALEGLFQEFITLTAEEREQFAKGTLTEHMRGQFDALVFTKTLLLARLVHDRWPQDAPEALTEDLEKVFDVLGDAQSVDPQVLQEAITHPSLPFGLSHAVNLLAGNIESDPASTPTWVHAGVLHLMAATAAARTGAAVSNLRVPIDRGTVMLPGVGRAVLATEGVDPYGVATVNRTAEGLLTITGNGKTVVVPPEGQESPGWQPCEYLEVKDGKQTLRIDFTAFDQLNGFDAPAVPDSTQQGVDPELMAAWRERLQGAWSLFVRDHPQHVPRLAQTRVVAPVPSYSLYDQLSATHARHPRYMKIAFPNDAIRLAVAMMHEDFHNRLYEFGTLYPLIGLDAPELFVLYSPLRDDPRPPTGLLHAAFSLTGMLPVWQKLSTLSSGSVQQQAAYEFAADRASLRQALHSLNDYPEPDHITKRGWELIDVLMAQSAEWQDAYVAPEINRLRRMTSLSHQAQWLADHVELSRDTIANLTDQWVAGEQAGLTELEPRQITHSSEARSLRVRKMLTRMMIDRPDQFAELCQQPQDVRSVIPRGSPADVALLQAYAADLSGQPEAMRKQLIVAASLYEGQLRANPNDTTSLVGLGLTRVAQGSHALTRGALTEPHVLRGVQKELAIRRAAAADPIELATWLGEPAPEIS